jgi:hypothetical protein
LESILLVPGILIPVHQINLFSFHGPELILILDSAVLDSLIAPIAPVKP